MKKPSSSDIWIPLVFLLLHQAFPTVLASTISQHYDIPERQVRKRPTCQSPDIECVPPTDLLYGLICCSSDNVCSLAEKYDEAGAFNAFCVPDPQACLPGLFSCLPEINTCCPNEYICGTRTWDNVTLPVCFSPIFNSNGTYIPSIPVSTESLQTTQPTDTRLPGPDNSASGEGGGGGGGGQAYISKGTLAGLVIGTISGSVLVTFFMWFVVHRYRNRPRNREDKDLSEPRPVDPIPQPEPYPSYEAGGDEIREVWGGGILAELPGEGGLTGVGKLTQAPGVGMIVPERR